MTHVNLLERPDLLELFWDTVDTIDHKNYNRKEIDLTEFDYFSLVLDGDKIAAFSGLMKGRWGDRIGRCASRLWVQPEYRTQGLVPSDFNSTTMMPEQILWAENSGKYDMVFWSREYPHKRHFAKMVKRSTLNCPYGYIHQPLNLVYNVCKKGKDHEGCWQRIAYVEFNKEWGLDLDSRNN